MPRRMFSLPECCTLVRFVVGEWYFDALCDLFTSAKLLFNQLLHNMGSRPLRTGVSSKLGKHGFSSQLCEVSRFSRLGNKCGPAPSLQRALGAILPPIFTRRIRNTSFFWNTSFFIGVVSTHRGGQSGGYNPHTNNECDILMRVYLRYGIPHGCTVKFKDWPAFLYPIRSRYRPMDIILWIR